MTIGMIGADPQAMRELAVKFDAAADQLDETKGSVQAWVGRGDIWKGLDNQRFVTNWNSGGSSALANVSAQLRRSANILRVNANEQDAASSDGGSITSGSGLFSRDAPNAVHSGTSQSAADSSSFAREFLDTSREFLDLGVSRISTADLVSLLGGIGLKSGHGTALDLALAAPDLIDELLNPDVSLATSVNSTIAVATDMTGGALFALGAKSNNPAVMLLGTGYMSVGLAMEAASEADFSPAGLQTTWDYAKENRGVVVEEFGKATVQVFQDLGKKMAGAFIGGKLGR